VKKTNLVVHDIYKTQNTFDYTNLKLDLLHAKQKLVTELKQEKSREECVHAKTESKMAINEKGDIKGGRVKKMEKGNKGKKLAKGGVRVRKTS